MGVAVTKISGNSALKLELQTGIDGFGNPTYRTKGFNNIKATAADEDLFEIAAGLSELQDHNLSGIIRQDNAELVME